MTTTPDIRLVALGDSALQISFGGCHDSPQVLTMVVGASDALGAARESGALVGVRELVPSSRSILLVFDPALGPPAAQRRLVRMLAQRGVTAAMTQADPEHPGPAIPESACHTLPVHYGGDTGRDLARIADYAGVSADEVVARHSAATYRVRAIGFAPGFAYLGELDPAIATPRLETPRQLVPAGAVGIAEGNTAVYPAQSPGGWNLIGRCPARLFDVHRKPAMTLAVGDQVRFRPVSAREFEQLSQSA